MNTLDAWAALVSERSVFTVVPGSSRNSLVLAICYFIIYGSRFHA